MSDYSKLTLGELTVKAVEVREQKRVAEKEAANFGKELATLNTHIQNGLDAIGMDKASFNGVTVSISTTDVPVVEDWEAAYAYIQESGHLHLLQKRVSVTAYRELLTVLGEPVPGMSTFTKRDISMRVS